MQLEDLKVSPKSFTMLVVYVFVHACPSYLLSIPSICLAMDGEEEFDTGGNSKSTSPLNSGGRYFTLSQRSVSRFKNFKSDFARGLL